MTWWRSVCIACLVTCACGGQAEAPSEDESHTSEAPTTARAPRCPVVERVEAPPTLRDARVYVDTSGSMRGFTERGSRRLSSVHQAVVDSLTEIGARGERCLLGQTFDCAEAPPTVIAYDDPRVYTESASRIDAVLRREPPPARVDPDHPPLPDALDSTGLTVILTDGMQVAGQGESGSDDCASGGDPHCIATLIAARVREGYAFHVVQQVLAFDGPHFAERTLGPEHLAQTRAHLDDVRYDARYNGIEFSADRLTIDSRTGHHSFRYRGTKPLLFFVLGRDHAKVARFVAALVRELRRQPIHPGRMTPEQAVEQVQVAPLPDASAVSLTSFDEAPPDAQRGLPVERLREMRVSNTVRDGANIRAALWCGANGAHFYRIPYALPSSELPLFVTQSFALEGPAGAIPQGAATAATPVQGQTAFEVGLNCRALPQGQSAVGYELVRTLQVGPPAALEREWWHARSGSSPYESPELPYGLLEVVLRSLEAQTSGCSTHGRTIVSIQREGA